MVPLRLAQVFIDNRPFDQVISGLDHAETFFYIDQPYYGCDDDYGEGIFSQDDHRRLRDILSYIKGKFILSLNDAGEVRAPYRDFWLDRAKTMYLCGKYQKKRVTNLLISNIRCREESKSQ